MSPLSVFKETGGFKIGSTQNKRMADRVALLVQARQDKTDRISVKHLETVGELLYTVADCHFTLSGAHQSF